MIAKVSNATVRNRAILTVFCSFCILICSCQFCFVHMILHSQQTFKRLENNIDKAKKNYEMATNYGKNMPKNRIFIQNLLLVFVLRV